MRLALLLLSVFLAGCGGAPDRPSILLVTIDTLRADAVGAYGNESARTPRLDTLAAEGTRFTRVFTVCPLTLPTHTTLLTGMLPPEHGFRDNDPAAPLPGRDQRLFPTLAETFREAGYETAAFVSASVLSRRTGLDQGFQTWDEPDPGAPGSLRYSERPGGETAERAAKWLAGRRGPYFAWVHLFDPHEPYAPPLAFRTGGAPGSAAAYHDEVAYADHCLGTILDAAASTGRPQDLMVAVTSDHGEGLGEHGEPTHGYLLFETTLHVPLVLRRPGHVAEGAAIDGAVSLADLPATLLDAAGLPPPAGRRSLLAGGERPPPVAESLYGYRLMGWAQLFAARQDDSKLIRGSHSSFFDLTADPGEQAPVRRDAPALIAAIDRHRVLESGLTGEAPAIEEMAGLPYLGGVGRSRLAPIPWEANAALRTPDPVFAEALDRAKGSIGQEPYAVVARTLADLDARDPGNPSVAFWTGRNAEAAGMPKEAATAFGDAFARGLTEAKVVFLWIKNLMEAGETSVAGAVIRDKVPLVRGDAPLLVMVGAYWDSVGNREEALRCAGLAEALASSKAERDLVSRFRHNLRPTKDQ